MATLPTESAVGPLVEDRLPRRMGVGGWQPGDLVRGAQEFARGGETFGQDLSLYAGVQQRDLNNAQEATAESNLAVANIQARNAQGKITDPDQASQFNGVYADNLDAAAGTITDPNVQAQFRIKHAPTVAQNEAAGDLYATGLRKNQTLANFDNTATTLTNAAVSTDDDSQRAAALGAFGTQRDALVQSGVLTPEQAQARTVQFQHDYATARLDSEIARAETTGDTSRLRQLAPLFSFGQQAGATPSGVQVLQAAIGGQESNDNPNAPTSVTGARGPRQIEPGTFAQFAQPGEKIDNATDNRNVSNRIISYYSQKYNGDPARVAVAYFSGEGNVAPPGSPAPWIRNAADPTGKTTSSYVSDVLGRVQNLSKATAASGGATAPVAAVGDSLAVGVAGAVGQNNVGNKFAQPSIQPSAVQAKIDALTKDDISGKTIVLSSGASNAPGTDPATYLPKQIKSLQALGANVVVIGTGTRPDLAPLNSKIQTIATQNGAKFQPLDAGMLGPDGVHLIQAGYKAIAQQAGGPSPQGAPPTQSAFMGVPPPGAGANPHLTPPQSAWPSGAQSVVQNGDGSLSYQMQDGSSRPIPGSRASGAPGAPSPTGTGTLLDALKPTERAELGLRLQNSIDTIERRNDSALKQQSASAQKDMSGRIADMTSGIPMGQTLFNSMKNAYANSADPDVRNSFAAMANIRDNLAAYQGQTPAQVAADVKNKEADYTRAINANPSDPFNPFRAQTLKAAQAFLKTYQEEAFKDPLGRAAKSGFLPNGVTPIDPNDPNVETAIQKRLSDAQVASSQLGVPIKYLQQSERPMMRQIAQQGGQPMVDMARHIVEAAGSQSGAIFKEIGGDAPAFQTVGTLAASGGDPQTVTDIANYIHAKQDKNASRDIPVINDTMLAKRSLQDPVVNALSSMSPDLQGRTKDAAQMLMSEQARQNGWDQKIDAGNITDTFVQKAYNQALGAWYDKDNTQYGGLADRKSGRNFIGLGGNADKVLVPNDMKADDFNGVIGSITDSALGKLPSRPMGADHLPITAAQFHNAAYAAVPDSDGMFRGKYVVYGDGTRDADHLFRGADGKPWVFDMSTGPLSDSLRGTNKDAFTPNPALPSKTQPIPRPYERTPGMVALESGAENP